jgi:hypothetical protein
LARHCSSLARAYVDTLRLSLSLPVFLCLTRSLTHSLSRTLGAPEEHNSYAVNFIEATKIIKQRLPGAKVRSLHTLVALSQLRVHVHVCVTLSVTRFDPHTCTLAPTHKHTGTHTQAHWHPHTMTLTHIHTHTHTRWHPHTSTLAPTHIQTDTHTHTNWHPQTHSFSVCTHMSLLCACMCVCMCVCVPSWTHD